MGFTAVLSVYRLLVAPPSSVCDPGSTQCPPSFLPPTAFSAPCPLTAWHCGALQVCVYLITAYCTVVALPDSFAWLVAKVTRNRTLICTLTLTLNRCNTRTLTRTLTQMPSPDSPRHHTPAAQVRTVATAIEWFTSCRLKAEEVSLVTIEDDLVPRLRRTALTAAATCRGAMPSCGAPAVGGAAKPTYSSDVTWLGAMRRHAKRYYRIAMVQFDEAGYLVRQSPLKMLVVLLELVVRTSSPRRNHVLSPLKPPPRPVATTPSAGRARVQAREAVRECSSSHLR
jgi:hypothetical protein